MSTRLYVKKSGKFIKIEKVRKPSVQMYIKFVTHTKGAVEGGKQTAGIGVLYFVRRILKLITVMSMSRMGAL